MEAVGEVRDGDLGSGVGVVDGEEESDLGSGVEAVEVGDPGFDDGSGVGLDLGSGSDELRGRDGGLRGAGDVGSGVEVGWEELGGLGSGCVMKVEKVRGRDLSSGVRRGVGQDRAGDLPRGGVVLEFGDKSSRGVALGVRVGAAAGLTPTTTK